MDKKVLFVDDQEEILELIQIKLKNEPYERFFANSVEEAMKILNSENINVVITDILMPGVDGHDFLSILKENFPKVVRVILSGFSQVNSIISAINNEDVYRYITKPWKIDESAKELILDALKYSDLINQSELLTIEKLKEILEYKRIKYEIKSHPEVFEEKRSIKINDTNFLVFEEAYE